MTGDSVEIERIVREVMARGRASPASEPALCPRQAVLDLGPEAAVVSLAALDGRLDGILELLVPPRAVITPSAREELARRRICLARTASPSTAADTTLVLAIADTSFQTAGLVHDLSRLGLTTVELARSGLAAGVGELCDAVARDGSCGMVLCGRPWTAICIANRNKAVRAVGGTDAGAVLQGIEETRANVAVVNPARVGPSGLRRVAAALKAARSGAVPAELRLV
jgi:hypothetical protein